MLKIKFKPLVLLVALTFLIGIGLRSFLVWQQDFWEDELWSVHLARVIPDLRTQLMFPINDRPPLHFLIVRAFLMISDNYLWLRSLSLMSGIIMLIWLWKLFWKKSQFWSACVVLATCFSPFMIQFSWELPGYSLLMLVGTAMLALAIEWQDQILKTGWQEFKFSFSWLVRWFFWSCLGLLTNYAFLPFWVSFWFAVWVSQASFIKGFWSRAFKALMTQFLVILPILSLCAYYLLAGQYIGIEQTTAWIAKPNLTAVLILISGLLGQTNFLVSNFSNFISLNQLLDVYRGLGLGLFLIFFGVIWLKKHQTNFSSIQFFILKITGITLILNIGLICFQSATLPASVFLPRYFVSLAVLSAVSIGTLMSVWLEQIKENQKIIWLWLVALVIIGFGIKDFLTQYGIYLEEPLLETPYRTMIKSLITSYRPGDQILFINQEHQTIFMSYYFNSDRYSQAGLLEKYLVNEKISPLPAGAKLWVTYRDNKNHNLAENAHAIRLINEFGPNNGVKTICQNQPQQAFINDFFIIMTCNLNSTLPKTLPKEKYLLTNQ